MAQRGVRLDQGKISCSICLDLLQDPVTIPCGHSYCMNCIKTHWHEEQERQLCSCPQCRQTFTPRPVLMKSTVLADLVEELKKTGLQTAGHCYAGPGDVACDFCTERKLKALKSCLICQVSYCEKHVQPHYSIPQLRKHKLVEPSKNLQENVHASHDETLRISKHILTSGCEDRRQDVSERRELEARRHNIQRRIEDRSKDVEVLRQEVKAIDRSADAAVKDSDGIFTELICLMEKRRSDVRRQIRSQQETEVSQVEELQEKVEQEIFELKRKDAELEKLSRTQNHDQFLQKFSFFKFF